MSTRSDISDPLLSVLRRIEKGHIRVDLNPAFRFLRTVHDKIRIGHRRYLVEIEKCLKCVQGGESPSNEELKRAMDVYNKYVNGFILENAFNGGRNMKIQHALSDNSDQVPGRLSDGRKSIDLSRDLGTVLQDQSHEIIASNPEAKDVQTAISHDFKPQTFKLSRRHTEPEPLEKQHSELAKRFKELYLNEYKDAYDEIVKDFGTEKTIRHLLWIITEVRLICLNIAERQLKEMEKSAIGIMENPMPKHHPTNSNYPVRHVTDTLPTSLELLLTFRRRNADLSIPYVKQECREEICRALIESFDFPHNKAKAFRLVAYINKGAELVWLMSVQDPPIVLEVINRDAEGTRFNNEHYNPYTQSGTAYQYGVWPVLRYGKGGPIISRGIAQERVKPEIMIQKLCEHVKFADVYEPDVVDTIYLPDQIPVIYEPDQIAEIYMGIYKDLWNKVAGALKVKIAENTTHKLLLEIVQKAFRECQIEKNDLLYEMNKCVGRTLFPDNKEIIDLKPGSEQESLLTMFLRSNGNLALLRLTQKFTKIIENTTLQKYNIPTVDSIFKTYVKECVRVTWSMVLTDPPVHMVYGHPDTKIDPDWYTVLQGTSQVIDQVIWPALLEYKDGPILVRGFVYCR